MINIAKIQEYKANPERIPDDEIELDVVHQLHYTLINWSIKHVGFGQLVITANEHDKTVFECEGLSDRMIVRILAKWVKDSIKD